MKEIKLRVFYSMILGSLIFNPKLMSAQDFQISGKAGDAKLGAVIITADNDVYYMDKLSSWSPDFLGKQVRVTGKIVIKKLKKIRTNNAGITSPTIKIIKKPKFEILE